MCTYLCDYMSGPINIQMRRTDARLRRTDAHNIKVYIMMEMGGLDGYWMENMLVGCFFWMGLGWFLDDLG